MEEKLLRLGEVREIVGVAKSTIYAMMAHNRFPRPLQIGPKSVRWRESEIAEWLESRPRSTGWGGE